MPQVSDVDVSRAQNYQFQKDRADNLAHVLAAIVKRHGPLTFTTPELQDQIGRDPVLVTSYNPATDTYTLRVK